MVWYYMIRSIYADYFNWTESVKLKIKSEEKHKTSEISKQVLMHHFLNTVDLSYVIMLTSRKTVLRNDPCHILSLERILRVFYINKHKKKFKNQPASDNEIEISDKIS